MKKPGQCALHASVVRRVPVGDSPSISTTYQRVARSTSGDPDIANNSTARTATVPRRACCPCIVIWAFENPEAGAFSQQNLSLPLVIGPQHVQPPVGVTYNGIVAFAAFRTVSRKYIKPFSSAHSVQNILTVSPLRLKRTGLARRLLIT